MRYTENQIFRIAPETFDEIDDYIRACEITGRNVQFGMDALVMLMAYTNEAFAQRLSAGILDPQARHGRGRVRQLQGRRFIGHTSGPSTPQPIYGPDPAWKIPVRRITERYYKGWKVRRLAPGVWMLYNESREAWFIEFGIHPSGYKVSAKGGKYYMKGSRRVRRPIRKLSLKKTLALMDESRAGERVWEMIYAPFRPGRHITARGEAITLDAVQSVTGMRLI